MGFKFGLKTRLGEWFHHDEETSVEKLSEIAVHPNTSESQKEKATDALVDIAKHDSQTKRILGGVSILGILGIAGTVVIDTVKRLKDR